MADTHPNAFRAEAEEKRKLAAQFADEANVLDAQAKELEDQLAASQPEAPAETTSTPPATESDEKESDKKGGGKIFNKK